jgi:molybdopterin-binding protein
MSSFIATVLSVQNSKSLHVVKFKYYEQTLCMMSLQLNSNIQKGVKVKLSVKPTHVVLAKNLNSEISFENRLETTIVSIDSGELLSSVKVSSYDSFIEAIITKESEKKMDLKIGDEVLALIQASELSIVEVLDV